MGSKHMLLVVNMRFTLFDVVNICIVPSVFAFVDVFVLVL